MSLQDEIEGDERIAGLTDVYLVQLTVGSGDRRLSKADLSIRHPWAVGLGTHFQGESRCHA